jgi:hypothetical protein
MSALNGNNNGSRPSLLARMLGFISPPVSKNGNSSHIMTSEGAASVNIEKLLKSPDFKSSAGELKLYLDDKNTSTR